jgi:hypothetical protein
MATEIDAKGDLIVGTGADAFARLAVGTNGHTLVADSTVSPTGLKWAAPAGGGKVLQVVEATYSTQTATSSSSFSDTGLTATITPSAATSKVLVLVSHQSILFTGAGHIETSFRLFRASTNVQDFGFKLGRSTSGEDLGLACSTNHLDSPNTTSATTYKTQFRSENNNSQVVLNSGGTNDSTIILMEIGA